MKATARRLLLVLIASLACAWPVGAAAEPTANFRADPRRGEVPLTVQFTNTSNGGTPPLTFLWHFGDGATSSLESPAHTFNTPSSVPYEVTMTVTDSTGQRNTKTDFITVDGPTLVAALLPVSRSVTVGSLATAFLTVLNAGAVTATDVRVKLDPTTGPGGVPLPATLTSQTTDPATNQVNGPPNQPVTIPPRQGQSYLLTLEPSQVVPPTDVRFDIQGTNSTRNARTVSGLNTLLLSASQVPTPDIVAVAATPDANGMLVLSGSPPMGAFSVATANVGAGGDITVSADTGGTTLPVSLLICRTNPNTGLCESAMQPSVPAQMNTGANATFSVFVSATGVVPNNPESNRVFVRFSEGGATRGATSVAIKTQP